MSCQLPRLLKETIEQRLEDSIVATQAVTGGCINRAAIGELACGSRAFIKWNSNNPGKMFSAEARGLEELRKADVFRIPKVLAYEDGNGDGQPSYLVLEAFREDNARSGSWRELGRKLGEQHQCKSTEYGFGEDNFIGSLPQKNGSSNDWAKFFIHQRLDTQARLGRENGWFNNGLEELYYEKKPRIEKILATSSGFPSLLHGDLWSGNVFWADFGPTIIDPAVYYGDREADIAMTECFSRFHKDFYRGYNEVFPLEEGYEQRKAVLNLYHLMTHSNLFGGSYISSFKSALGAI